MYFMFWILFLICGAAVLFAFPGILWLELRRSYGGPRSVTCPETHSQVTIGLNRDKAAKSLFGPRVVEVESCTRWPERKDCPQDCVPEALTLNPTDTFAINHTGVVLAALTSWAASGLLRYSPFARELMASIGLPEARFWERIGMRFPVIVGFFGLLFTAYVFTWIVRHTQQTGVLHSLTTGGLIWLAVVGITIPETLHSIPARIFALNALAMLIALVVQGILIGLLVVPKRSGIKVKM